jgi:hypothetical protein
LEQFANLRRPEGGPAVPLSEHEQRLLEQMEKALYAEDPKFATSLRSTPGARAARGRAALGVLGILAGLGLLVAGVATTVIALGVVGFVVMLVGSVVVYSAFGARPAEGAAAEATGPAPKPSASPGFMDRMEDRWRRRSEDGQQ